MTLHPESAHPTSSSRLSEWAAAEAPAFATLRAQTAAALRAEAPRIATRWVEQSRTVSLREQGDATGLADADAATGLVESIAGALMTEGATPDDLVSRGLAFGTDAFEQAESLHHALKRLDLLSAMMLYVMETSLEGCEGGAPADGIRMSRRLQQATSLLGLSVTKGYTQAMNGALRDRFRRLRHDLRNPLGTIKSVLAMMDDETMPPEARTHPRFRDMAKRNARSLGELIADRLSDAEAVLPVLSEQSASLRTIACAVRRDLRAAATARGAMVTVVGNMPARVVVDAIGLELVLHELLHAALQDASAGDELTIEFGGIHDGRAVIALRCAPARPPIGTPEMVRHVALLAQRMLGELEVGEQDLTLTMPVGRVESPRDVDASSATTVAPVADARSAAASSSDGGEAGDDLPGAREREHGESRAL